MSYQYAQTFYVDPTAVSQSSKVNITEIQLWFRAKPRVDGNKSNIFAPGVNVGIVPTRFGVPIFGQQRVDTQIQWARLEWGSIQVTADATLPARFRFPSPVPVDTGKEYAIIVQFDGDEDFLLWTNKQGDKFVGTNNISPGVAGRFVGKLYTYISPTGITSGTSGYSASALASGNTVVPSVSSQLESPVDFTEAYLLSSWRPLDNVDLKFQVNIARYFHNGFPVQSNASIIANTANWIYGSFTDVTPIGNNMLRVTVAASPTEFITFDRTETLDTNTLFGEWAYQDRPYYTGGKPTYATCAVTNAASRILSNASFQVANGSTFRWGHIFSTDASQNQYIVVTSLDHDGAGLHRVNVRRVLGVSNTILGVDEPLTFTNSAARFFVAPVGRVTSKLKSFGINGKMVDLMSLSGSNANSSVRFVNNNIATVTISANGTGYANSDYLEISGYEEVTNELYGGYKATANLVTNGSGALTAVWLTNAGCGFVNPAWLAGANVVIKNANGITSSGTGATFTYTIGAKIKTELTGGRSYFGNCVVTNLDAMQIIPVIEMQNPGGTNFGVKHRSLYKSLPTANTTSGKKYFVNPDPSTSEIIVQNGKLHNFSVNNIPTIVSRSNQYAIRYANGSVANDSTIGQYLSKTTTYTVDVAANNDYIAMTFGNTLFTSNFAKYIINNDYTNEHTNYGNAWAKHVSTKVNFADGRQAEDLLVFLTAFRPFGTDLKVYARIHNSLDEESFDLKDWTLLEQTDGLGVYSNPDNQTDLKEFTYNFPAYPNAAFTFTGTVTTTLGSNSIVGAGTTWHTNATANVVVGDLVRIYQPLFPNNYMVASVGSVTNNTALTLTESISNNGLVGSGLRIEKVGFPRQAFNNILESNVVTYFTNTGAQFTTYDSMQIKIIFLSNTDTIVPKIDDVRVIGVSA